jgi:3-oxoacyl-[acyl-carrier protein] reductase
MEAQGWGRIIFDSSVAAFTGGVVGPHYASSKSAQHGFVHWLAGNVAKKGVTVNAVAPALIGDTNMLGSADDEEMQKKVASSKLLDGARFPYL